MIKGPPVSNFLTIKIMKPSEYETPELEGVTELTISGRANLTSIAKSLPPGLYTSLPGKEYLREKDWCPMGNHKPNRIRRLMVVGKDGKRSNARLCSSLILESDIRKGLDAIKRAGVANREDIKHGTGSIESMRKHTCEECLRTCFEFLSTQIV